MSNGDVYVVSYQDENLDGKILRTRSRTRLIFVNKFEANRWIKRNYTSSEVKRFKPRIVKATNEERGNANENLLWGTNFINYFWNR